MEMVQNFSFNSTGIEGLYLIKAFNAEDCRGCFTKDYSKEVFEKNNIFHNLSEVFYTTSHKGVIRALHFQRVKQQPKLVRCISGHIWDVVVDLRKNSPTFKKWVSFDLCGDSYSEILVPEGCAHGYIVLEKSIVSYKCSEKFYADYDGGIIWNDVDLNISWPIDLVGGLDKLILSDKDQNLPSFKEFMECVGGF